MGKQKIKQDLLILIVLFHSLMLCIFINILLKIGFIHLYIYSTLGTWHPASWVTTGANNRTGKKNVFFVVHEYKHWSHTFCPDMKVHSKGLTRGAEAFTLWLHTVSGTCHTSRRSQQPACWLHVISLNTVQMSLWGGLHAKWGRQGLYIKPLEPKVCMAIPLFISLRRCFGNDLVIHKSNMI